MLGPAVLITALVAGASAGFTKRQYAPDEVDKLAKASLPKLQEWLAKNPQGGCTLENAIRRKEW
jgi:tyrosinase